MIMKVNLSQLVGVLKIFDGIYLSALAEGLKKGASLEEAHQEAAEEASAENKRSRELGLPELCAAGERSGNVVTYYSHSGKKYVIKEKGKGKFLFSYPAKSCLANYFKEALEV